MKNNSVKIRSILFSSARLISLASSVILCLRKDAFETSRLVDPFIEIEMVNRMLTNIKKNFKMKYLF